MEALAFIVFAVVAVASAVIFWQRLNTLSELRAREQGRMDYLLGEIGEHRAKLAALSRPTPFLPSRTLPPLPPIAPKPRRGREPKEPPPPPPPPIVPKPREREPRLSPTDEFLARLEADKQARSHAR